MIVSLYFYDDELNTIYKDEFDINRLDELFNNRLANSKMTFDYVEERTSKTSFILSRSKMDFLDVGINDENIITLYSQGIYYSKGLFGSFKKVFGSKNFFDFIEVDWATAKAICQDYVTLDRQDFENKYHTLF